MLSRVGPHLTRQRFGAVVNIVHVYSFERGAPIFAHSGDARAGVVNLTRSPPTERVLPQAAGVHGRLVWIGGEAGPRPVHATAFRRSGVM